MQPGEIFTRLSVWLALLAATIGIGLHAEAHGRPAWLRGARRAWTAGCGIFLAHVTGAFAHFHHWSHADAYRETARQTAALTGWNWGGGIYFNYIFAAAWIADVAGWWFAPAGAGRHPSRLRVAWHGFFFFMVLNGAVIFVDGPRRWLGTILCGAILTFWWRERLPKTRAFSQA